MIIYLDCNATTPIDPEVSDLVNKRMRESYGNAGSRTHEFGVASKKNVEIAREQIAKVVRSERDDVIFTSGATESNNLAILGLANFGNSVDRRHIITTAIEHKAVLEPIEYLGSKGFDVSYLSVDQSGSISPEELRDVLRKDTLLVSVMQVNNETGVIQPINDCADILEGSDTYFHVDAAQGFGKAIEPLTDPRIDLISVTAHKIYGPKGIGALVARRRKYKRPPLQPLMYGGGQEQGLRPGTLPVPLISGFGLAAEKALINNKKWHKKCEDIKISAINMLEPLSPSYNGDITVALPNVLNFSLPNVNSEAAIITLKGIAAVSNGSACTSNSYNPSHVLTAMGLPNSRIESAIRMSWSHMTEGVDWYAIVGALRELL